MEPAAYLTDLPFMNYPRKWAHPAPWSWSHNKWTYLMIQVDPEDTGDYRACCNEPSRALSWSKHSCYLYCTTQLSMGSFSKNCPLWKKVVSPWVMPPSHIQYSTREYKGPASLSWWITLKGNASRRVHWGWHKVLSTVNNRLVQK